MRVLDDMCDVLEDELKQIAKKDDMTPQDLDTAYKAVDIIKDITTIKAMKEAEGNSYDNYSRRPYDYGSYDDYSNGYNSRRSYDSYGRYGRDGDGDGRYSEERGGRNSRGYSGHEDREQLMQKIEELERKVNKM